MERGVTGIRGLLVAMAMALALATTGPAYAVDGLPRVVDVRLGIHPDKTRFVLEVGGKLSFRAAVAESPWRIVVDLPDLAWSGAETVRPGKGIIRQWHVERPGAGALRLILEIGEPVRIGAAVVLPASDGHQARLVIDLEPASPELARTDKPRSSGTPPEAAPVSAPPPTPSPPPTAVGIRPAPAEPASEAIAALVPPPSPSPRAVAPPVKLGPSAGAAFSRVAPVPPMPPPTPAVLTDRPAPRSESPPAQLASLSAPPVPSPSVPAKPRRTGPAGKPMIAIDPGHGGVDPGATGINGIREKLITLAEAKELKRQLEASGRYRVMLTREEDEFVALRERVSRARQAGADLFISLHADSISRPEIRGLSVYTQSDKGSDQEAETLAAKENRADAIGGIDLSRENDQVATILIDLAQRDTRNHSRRFAVSLLREAGRGLQLLPKPDRSAAFAVLTAPDVPSVLIEMGYLSSPEDSGMLTRVEHRQRLASILLRAIDSYFIWLTGGRRS